MLWGLITSHRLLHFSITACKAALWLNFSTFCRYLSLIFRFSLAPFCKSRTFNIDGRYLIQTQLDHILTILSHYVDILLWQLHLVRPVYLCRLPHISFKVDKWVKTYLNYILVRVFIIMGPLNAFSLYDQITLYPILYISFWPESLLMDILGMIMFSLNRLFIRPEHFIPAQSYQIYVKFHFLWKWWLL